MISYGTCSQLLINTNKKTSFYSRDFYVERSFQFFSYSSDPVMNREVNWEVYQRLVNRACLVALWWRCGLLPQFDRTVHLLNFLNAAIKSRNTTAALDSTSISPVRRNRLIHAHHSSVINIYSAAIHISISLPSTHHSSAPNTYSSAIHKSLLCHPHPILYFLGMFHTILDMSTQTLVVSQLSIQASQESQQFIHAPTERQPSPKLPLKCQ